MASPRAPWIRITTYLGVVLPERMQIVPLGRVRDEPRRPAVLASMIERCVDRTWILLAAHVRTNHVHIVVEAEAPPERVMNDLKSFASRRLNELRFYEVDRKRWARHGSTRWLWKRDAVLAAIEYVIDKQGIRMAAYEK
jgi:REP element-mobilizing transposase RayT